DDLVKAALERIGDRAAGERLKTRAEDDARAEAALVVHHLLVEARDGLVDERQQEAVREIGIGGRKIAALVGPSVLVSVEPGAALHAELAGLDLRLEDRGHLAVERL